MTPRYSPGTTSMCPHAPGCFCSSMLHTCCQACRLSCCQTFTALQMSASSRPFTVPLHSAFSVMPWEFTAPSCYILIIHHFMHCKTCTILLKRKYPLLYQGSGGILHVAAKQPSTRGQPAAQCLHCTPDLHLERRLGRKQTLHRRALQKAREQQS